VSWLRLRDRVVSGLIDALGRATVQARPFAHFAVAHAFADDVYADMLSWLPDDDAYRPDNPRKYALPDGTVARGTRSLGPHGLETLPSASRAFWAGISAALQSEAVRERVLAMLAGDLSRRFGVTPDTVRHISAHPRPLLVRDRPGYWIEPHPDSPAKVATLQFYLARGGSHSSLGTSLYRLRPWRIANWWATGRPLEEFHRFRFEPGSGYGLAVGRWSWHGVEKIPSEAGVRDSLMLVYYRDPSRGWE
jgi:hypothetical protein